MSVQQEKFREIADAIRAKTGETDPIKPSEFASKVDGVYDAGAKSEYDRFWDTFQNNGSKTNYNYAFYQWSGKLFKPKHNMSVTKAQQMFNEATETDIASVLKSQNVILDFSKATTMYLTFGSAKTTKLPVIDLSSATNIWRTFFNMAELTEIEKVIFSEATGTSSINWTMYNCPKLETVQFEGVLAVNGFNLEYSNKISKDSLLSLLNILKDYSGSGTAYTLTMGRTNLNKLTATEIAIATEKGWTLA